MRASIGLILLAFCLSACATLPATRQTPSLPAGVYGIYLDNDTGAINHAAWAFASPANTRGRPIEAAKAVIALEYLSGELKENPRWVQVDSNVKQRMAQARDQLRQILGIRPDAPPQAVVNTLLALTANLEAGNQQAAMQILASPLFIRAPEQTLQTLSNLPYVQEANLATTRVEDQSFADGGFRS